MMGAARGFKIFTLVGTVLLGLAVLLNLLGGDMEMALDSAVFFVPVAGAFYLLRDSEPDLRLRHHLSWLLVALGWGPKG